MREIEQRLQQIPTRIVEHASISAILAEFGYTRINDKIAKLVKNGVLRQLKRGLYAYMPLYSEHLLSMELIANTLLSPSYVSLDYALARYNAIPERIERLTSITTQRSKAFKTPFGIFSYKQIKKELFDVGLRIENSQNVAYIIATKEKALCDKVFFTRDIELRNKGVMMEFLQDDLRLDLDEFKDANLDIFNEYFRLSKSHKIGILARIMKGVKR